MEFHEKLQALRRQQGFTQEELARRLYVSRTAVSKWESGRGYPNLESLKGLSRLFSVSIDELLSGQELVELAETDSRDKLRRLSGQIFGVLDLMSAVFVFLPLFGQPEGGAVRAVSLWAHTGMTGLLRALCLGALGVLTVFGVWELAISWRSRADRWCRILSVGLHTAAVLLFALSRQPYVTVLMFLLFLVKTLLMLQENRIK